MKYTQIKHAKLSRTRNVKVRQRSFSSQQQLGSVATFRTLTRFCEKWIIILKEAGSHIFQQLTLTRFFSVSSFGETHRWWIYLRSLDFPLKSPSWSEIITVIKQLPSEGVGFFIICLRWMMPVCICISVSAALHTSFLSFFFSCFLPPALNKGFSKDFGKKGPSTMPSTPGGGSKVVPIASLNPYQSKWVWLQFIPREAQFCFYSSAEQDSLGTGGITERRCCC